MSIIRYTSYFLFSLMFTGCGTTSSVNFTQATNNQNSSFLMLDERPVDSKQSHDENVAEGHKYYYGDNNLNPAGPELLKAFLQNRLGAELSGKTVSVTQFDISVFERGVSIDQNAMNNAAATVPNGYAAEPLAAALVWTIGSIASDKEVVIQIAGKIDNLPFSRSSSETQRGRVTEKSIKDTVDEALENVLIQIKTIIPAK